MLFILVSRYGVSRKTDRADEQAWFRSKCGFGELDWVGLRVKASRSKWPVSSAGQS